MSHSAGNLSPEGIINKNSSSRRTSPSSLIHHKSRFTASPAPTLNGSPFKDHTDVKLETITPTHIESFEEQQLQQPYSPARYASRASPRGSGWRSFFRSPDMVEGPSVSVSGSTSIHTSAVRMDTELGDSQTMDPGLLALGHGRGVGRTEDDIFGSTDKPAALLSPTPCSLVRRSDLRGDDEGNDQPYTGPARGLKGRPCSRTLTRSSENDMGATNGLSKRDFDSQEKIVPSDFQRQHAQSQHQNQEQSSSQLTTQPSLLIGGGSSRIWEPVDWENFSPHEEVPTMHEGSMTMLFPPPTFPSPRHRPQPLSAFDSSTRSTLGARIGSNAYWQLFDNVPRYDQGPLSASTNSATSTTVDTSFSGTTGTSHSTPVSASASDGSHGIATTHLIQGLTGFSLPGMPASSEPEYDSEEDGSPVLALAQPATRRNGSIDPAPMSVGATHARPIEIIVIDDEEDEGVAGLIEQREQGRQPSASGPMRSTRSSTRERRPVEASFHTPPAETTARPAKRAKRADASSSTASASTSAGLTVVTTANGSLSKPAVRPPGDRGQGRKPFSSVASPDPDSPGADGDQRDPEGVAAKKARRREINRKSARTLREKRKAELESAWAVVDQLRDQVRMLTEESKRERECRVVLQNELVKRGVDIAALGVDVDYAPAQLTQTSTISNMMQVDSTTDSDLDNDF